MTSSAYQQEYREAHRDERVAYAAEYYQENKSRLAASQRKYHREHRDAINARQKAYREAHKVIDAQKPKCHEPKPESKTYSHKQQTYHDFILELFGVKFGLR
jgi:hypothetical protein